MMCPRDDGGDGGNMSRLLALPLMTLLMTACVTINIYFPEAAAEEAARTIVRDVLKSEPAEQSPPSSSKEGRPQSAIHDDAPALRALGWVLHLVVGEAHAAQADININTATISAIRASMQKRQQALAPFYRSGAVGFDNNGGVKIRDLASISLGDRNRVKKLVADENADRSRLYREIAGANGHPEWEADVRATFARVWTEEAKPGYWVQQPGGSWSQR